MTPAPFSTQLKHFMDTIDCSASELSEASSLSSSVISRYLSGLREPFFDSLHINALAEGLAQLASSRSDLSPDDFSKRAIADSLARSITGLENTYSDFLDNLRSVISALDISNVSIAKALNYDASYVSRLLSGARRPSHLPDFIEKITSWLAQHCDQPYHIRTLAALLKIEERQLLALEDRKAQLIHFLTTNTGDNAAPAQTFVDMINSFDFDAFVKEIGYDTLKVPKAPFMRRFSKVYSGLEPMKQADLDWLKATVLSRADDDVIIFSDMPISEMGTDEEFVKKYSLGLAMMLKRGLTVHMIHDVHRPLEEMVLGLKSYIPMYMTGQIRPYYFPSPTAGTFHHLLKVSGSAALEGTVIDSHQLEDRYYLTSKEADLPFYRAKAAHLLGCARPLMHIFLEKDSPALQAYLRHPSKQKGELLTMDYGHSHITLRKGNYVLVSKEKSPVIHFCIELPQMVRAFEALF
ncbi:MAG: hypothetical protein IJJ07_00455 [Lachnospiraceae bacterium]|nr:hypothetical protein [Lachnospiraceae bacterium]MBQ6353408.1 hypothetical protein [Lachnospiraceae bacterium]